MLNVHLTHLHAEHRAMAQFVSLLLPPASPTYARRLLRHGRSLANEASIIVSSVVRRHSCHCCLHHLDKGGGGDCLALCSWGGVTDGGSAKGAHVFVCVLRGGGM